MSAKRPAPDLTDPDNPEWTKADFARADGPETLSDIERAAFPKTKVRGRPKARNPKTAISLRLDAEVVAHLRNRGPGWQTRVNAELTKAIADGRL